MSGVVGFKFFLAFSFQSRSQCSVFRFQFWNFRLSR